MGLAVTNYAYEDPWKLRVNQWDIISLTSVQSPSGTSISLSNVILYPFNRKPGWPYTRVELDRSTTSAWGAGATPQLSILLTGTFGFTSDTTSAGTLAADITSTTATTCTVSDGSLAGAGDMIIIGTERLVVADQSMTSTGLTQSGQGCTTASSADNQLAVTGTGSLHAGEVLLLDSERMLVTEVNGGVASVRRAYDGTILAIHSAASVSAARLLTVLRGQYGTTAATHANGDAVSRLRVPAKIRSLAVAEAVNQVLQETSGYARTVGGPDVAMPAPGVSLSEMWDEAVTAYGRKNRMRTV